MRTPLSSLKNSLDEKVEVVGFVHALRSQGKISFLRLRDREGSVQVVVFDQKLLTEISALTVESVLKIVGQVKKAPQVEEGYEIAAEKIEILSQAEPELPIPVAPEKGGGDSDITLRLDWRHLDLRSHEKQLIFKVWTALEQGFREYLLKQGFLQIYSPSFMLAPSESGAEVFRVEYFEGNAYLAQSPQFYKQMAMSAGLEKVFLVGPVFRAEPSFTTRHMTEFTGWDFELSYIEDEHEIMKTEESALIEGFTRVKEQYLPELTIPSSPFPALKFKDAKAILQKEGVVSDKQYDFAPQEEKALGKYIKAKHNHDFLWLTDYPNEERAFYHMQKDGGLTRGFDLLYKGVEVTTGAVREHRLDRLIDQARAKGLDEKSLAGYFNFFRYGCPPHGGVGIGPGRIVMQILDLKSVKEATYVPRDVKRLKP